MSTFRRLAAAVPLLGCSALVVAGCGASDDPQSLGSSEDEIVKCAAGATVKGVDVSYYQGNIDFAKVKAAGITFVIARVSDGSYMDTKFDTYWPAIKANGMIRGAYQFFEPGEDPVTQANIMINKLGKLGPGDLPVTLDVEVTGGQSPSTIASRIQTWVDHVTAGTGKAPMIYTSVGFWNPKVASSSFGSLPLWAANWGVSCPSLAMGWSDWKFWQYSDSGSVNGIPATVDLDYFNGTLADLQGFAGGGADWGAKYVSQSFPLATQALVMEAGSSVPAYIELKNIGAKTWDSNTRLGTTQPRDRSSAFVASDWIGPNRPSGVVNTTVPPGGTYKFNFTLHAPQKTGTYFEYFGVVEEGVAWFSDPGQLGPPDNQLEAQIQVVDPPPQPDAGTGGSGGAGGAGGSSGSGGAAGAGGTADDGGGTGGAAGWASGPDGGGAGTVIDGGHDGATSDAGADGDAAPASAPSGEASDDGGGCGCSTPGAPPSRQGAAFALVVAGIVATTRRRKGRDGAEAR